jgi:ParB family chromosome partitioning protein
MAKKGLGRGFDSLIPDNLFDETFDPTAEQDVKVSDLRDLRLADIVADPAQPRRTFEETALLELTESIRVHGVLQPIVVTPKDGKFMIVAGERRFRASKAAGQKTIPALIRTLTDQHKLELALIENLHRRDLNAIETATAYAKLRGQFNMTLEDIGKSVGGKSVSAISNTLRLLKLPKQVQEAIARGEVSEGQARPLIGMDEPKALKLLARIVDQHLSARAVEQLASNSTSMPRGKAAQAVNYKDEEQKLRGLLGHSVSVRSRAGNRGRIIIDFDNTEDLVKIIKRIR